MYTKLTIGKQILVLTRVFYVLLNISLCYRVVVFISEIYTQN